MKEEREEKDILERSKVLFVDWLTVTFCEID